MTDNHHTKERDEISGVETTGHEWDGLKELNNPAPRWWLMVFIITVIWSIGYWVVYPAWPTLSGHTPGTAGWTSKTKLAAEEQQIIERRGAYQQRINAASIDDIEHDPELYQFAIAGGQTMFRENCAACHGTGAEGGHGYPNLNDDDWLWGGDLQSIYTTLRHGVRSGHPQARESAMPAFGQMLKPKEIGAIAQHVKSLSGNAAPNEEGAALYASNCAVCHGASGKGDRALGAPNLSDAIWLYSKHSIASQIANPRMGVMPAWADRLPDSTIKMLAVYVHSLGGGEAGTATPKTEKPAAQ